MRKDLQIIFQDPYASLNPRRTVRQILSEAMEIQTNLTRKERDQKNFRTNGNSWAWYSPN